MKESSPPRFLAWLGPMALLFVGLVLPLAVFGKIADEVGEGETLGFDSAFLTDIHRHNSSGLDAFFIQVARWGGVQGLLPLCLLIIVAFWWSKQRGNALFLLSSVAGACLINAGAKHLFGRQRPALWLSPAPELDYGFPSGHAMLSTAFFLALIILLWPTKWRWPMLGTGIGCVALICLSRLYLGVHYPTDVAGGICASLAWVGGLAWVLRAKHGLARIRENFVLHQPPLKH